MEGIANLYSFLTIFTITLAFSTEAAAHDTIVSDEEALLAFKDHITTDPNRILANNWTAGSPVCGWVGVTCGKRHYRITALDISSMGLSGTIVPHLGNLSFLVSLNLSYNNFHGDIPYELVHLKRLKRLNMRVNALTGEIPSSVGSLKQLEYLGLNNNTFIGSIPPEIFNISTLQILLLSHNQLSGSLPNFICRYLQQIHSIEVGYNMLSGLLPSHMSQCSQLRGFGVSHNNISGSIPKEIWNLQMLEKASFANNNLEGKIPKEINNLTSLLLLNLQGNHLTGTIPQEIGNLTNLQYLDFEGNNLTGTIPQDLGNLVNLEDLVLGFNGLSGLVPESIFNISTLMSLELSFNYLSGSLPSTTGFRLPNLKQLFIAHNSFSGVLPISISNSSRLTLIDVDENNFGGTIPHSLGNLRFLQVLSLGFNNFERDPSSLELEFLTPLTNCNDLRVLSISSNNFLNGILPTSIGNFSKSMEQFDADGIGISGGIPVAIGNLSNLITLVLSNNQLTGSLPTSIGSLQNLQVLFLYGNHLSGSLSCNLFSLQRLIGLYLYNNMLSGAIPQCIGNASSLTNIRIDANKLNSEIPMTLWNLIYLLELNLSSNFLSGSMPVQVGNLNVLTGLDLSMNNLSGDIPDAIGNLQNLNYLSLSNNLFHGPIPKSIGKMVSLENLYLAQNNLSGSIPTTLEKLQYLRDLNVSYNNLVGFIPTGGPFLNFTAESFMFNKALCGDKRFHVSPCPATSPKKSWFKRPKHMLLLCFGLVALVAAVTLVSVYLILFRRKKKIQKTEELRLTIATDKISFYELQHATDGYNETNLLGQGSFGSVYRATLRDGRVVAVKVFNLQTEGALKSFDIECEVLRNLRHRNLTQVISSCSNLDFKAIVLEFMPNGSLDKWLHSADHFLSFTERLNIMIDVACALDYLHSGYPTPVVHADLKPSNVLLDENKVAHVSDFGISKMLGENSITYTKTLATFGYIAPEYGSEGLVSTKGDVYSFGIMLMEVFTRKGPSNEMFNESLTLHDWVHNSMESEILEEIIDDGLVEEERFALVMDCVMKIMKVAMDCTKVLPRERSDIGEVLATLNKIKLKL